MEHPVRHFDDFAINDAPVFQSHDVKQSWCGSSKGDDNGSIGCHDEPGFNQTSKKNEKPEPLLHGDFLREE